MVDTLRVSPPAERRAHRRARLAAVVAVATAAASLLLPQPAFAAGSAVARILEDGSAVYDDQDGPGRDQNGANGRVRRGDTVTYDFQYNYDGGGTTDPVIRSELPVGMSWTTVPVDCPRAGSAITAGPNGPATVLTCNLPSTTAAVSGRVTPIARVLTTTASNTDGTVRTVGFTLSDAAGVTAISNTVDVAVSADPNPYFDLAMNSVTSNRVGPTVTGPDGPEPSTIATFFFTINLARPYPYTTAGDTVRGVEPLGPRVTFTDDLGGMPPGAVVTRCAGVGSTSAGPNSGGGGLNGVTNSGQFVCAPDGTITITNADTSVTHFPRNYAPPPKVVSQQIDVAVPNSVIRRGVDGIEGTADDGSYPFVNRFVAFDPASPAGVSNFGDGTEDTSNNQLSGVYRIPIGIGAVIKRFGSTSFDRRVSPGATLTATIESFNTNISVAGQTVCDVFDHTAYQLGAVPTHESGTDSFVIEYGHPATYPASTAALATANCGDGDATWSADPTDPVLTGGLTSDGFREGIDRVRVRWTSPATPNITSLTRVTVRVIARSEFGGTTLVNRAVKNANGNISRSEDVGIWTQVNLGIVKSSIPQSAGTANRYSAGATIPFTINPSIARPRSGNAPATAIDGVTVTDILPTTEPRLVIAPGTANQPPEVASIEYCSLCDGSDWSLLPQPRTFGIRWLYGPVVPGTRLAQLTFRALSEVETPTNTTYINTATITAGAAAEAVPANVQYPVIVDAPATVLATKVSNTAIIPVDGAFTHQLSVRNNTSNILRHLDVIDVLPYAGDGRSPATVYSGGFSALEVTGLPAGLTAYVTSVSPRTLDSSDGAADGYADPLNPGDAGYIAPGTGRWSCTIAQLGSAGCPALEQVTGIRFAGDRIGLFPANTTFSWAVEVTTSGNADRDVYTNRFVGRVDRTELTLPIISPDATTAVIVPAVVVHTEVCVSTCDPATDDGWSSTATVPDGGEATLRVSVDNTGDEPGDVVVTDVLPDGLTVVPGTAVATQGSVAAFPRTWDVGSLAPGAGATLTFDVVATDPVAGPALMGARISDQFGQVVDVVDAAPPTIQAVTPRIVLIKSVAGTADLDGDAFIGSGDRVDYAFQVTNTGAIDFASVAVADPLIPDVVCPTAGLAAGATATCTGSYLATDADLAAAAVQNTATATGTPANGSPVTSAPSTATQPLGTAQPALTLTKSASRASYTAVGQQVTYSFVVTNTGNVSLTDVDVAEPVFTGTGALGAVSCPTTTLAPQQSVVCTADYAVTQGDIDAARIDNTAVASGDAPNGGITVTSAPSSVSIVAAPVTRSLTLALAPRVVDVNGNGITDRGDAVGWAVAATNTGAAALVDVAVTDASPGDPVCPQTSLDPGQSMTCVVSPQPITGAQVAGGRVSNTATATARDLVGSVVTADLASADIAVSQIALLGVTGAEFSTAAAAAALLLLAGALLLRPRRRGE